PVHLIEVVNSGTEPVAPLIVITGGGTGVTNPKLTNLTTGRTLQFEGTLEEGEMLVLDPAVLTAIRGDNPVVQSGTAQGGAAEAIVLAATASEVDEAYLGMYIELTGGTGQGQVRTIIGYNGTTKTAVVDEEWDTEPDGSTEYDIYVKPDEHY